MKRLLSLLVVIFSLAGMVYAEVPAQPTSESFQEGGLPVTPIATNFGVVGGYRYMRVTGKDVPVYNRPNGSELYRFEGGYDFVSLRTERGDWVEINPNEWVEKQYLQETYASQFTGVVINSEPNVPWGWILIGHYASSAPGGAEVKDDAYWVNRYQLATFYNTEVIDGWRWYDVGGGRWVKQTLVSKVQRVANPGVSSGRWVAVDLYEQNLVAYEGNTMVFATLISSGLPGNDTREGVYNVFAKTSNAAMDGAPGGYGDYRLENVPYAMYFDGDISLHGTYWHNRFGYRQSRGCVNLTISDARWLFEWLGENANVYVYYSQSY